MATETQGIEKQYTQQSLTELYALGGDLTAYTDTLESLKDYNPEKYDVAFTDITSHSETPFKGDQITRNYKDPFYETGEFASKKSEVMGAFQGRLTSIQTQRDQPGRAQLLAGSGGILG